MEGAHAPGRLFVLNVFAAIRAFSITGRFDYDYESDDEGKDGLGSRRSTLMSPNYIAVFAELILTPFRHVALVWGIVPLYFGLLLSELTSAKKSFRTAIHTGFSFLWAGTQWVYLQTHAGAATSAGKHDLANLPVLNVVVTGLVLALGALALYSGLRRSYLTYTSFLGHTRFSNYFMITIYPIQAHALEWTWPRLAVIALFAVPAWLILHFGLMPFRKK